VLFRILLEHGANVVALNNDCSIPLDICKSDEIREIFIQDINAKGLSDSCHVMLIISLIA